MPKRELFILDVGHGNCTLLKDDNGIVVIDTGPKSSLLEFLRTEGISKIDLILLSHSDEDHIGGLINLLANVEVGTVRYNPDSSKKSIIFDDLTFSLDDFRRRKEISCYTSLTVAESEKMNQGKVNIQILAPNTYIAGKGPGSTDRRGRKLTSNSNSAVIRFVLDGNPIALITGDIDSVGLDNMLEDNPDCNAPIVIFPHHGGKPGSGNLENFVEKFCEWTQPKIIIFSIGREKHLNPNPRLIEIIRQKLPDVRIICTQLSKHCSHTLLSTPPAHLSSKFAKGKQSNECCAGTIEIDLDDIDNSLLPQLKEHREFIQIAAPNSLCTKKLYPVSASPLVVSN